jgi:hypothetical protein
VPNALWNIKFHKVQRQRVLTNILSWQSLSNSLYSSGPCTQPSRCHWRLVLGQMPTPLRAEQAMCTISVQNSPIAAPPPISPFVELTAAGSSSSSSSSSEFNPQQQNYACTSVALNLATTTILASGTTWTCQQSVRVCMVCHHDAPKCNQIHMSRLYAYSTSPCMKTFTTTTHRCT